MELIIAERAFDRPLAPDFLDELKTRLGSCLETNRVEHLGMFVSRDRLRATCVYRAPDVEAVRRVNRHSGLPAQRLFVASLHTPTRHDTDRRPPQLETVVVTRSFDEPVALDAIQAIQDAGASGLQRHQVRCLQTYVSADRQRMICVHEAPDAESVRRAHAQVGMPFDDVWTATVEPAGHGALFSGAIPAKT